MLWFILVFDINSFRYKILAKMLILKLIVTYWLVLVNLELNWLNLVTMGIDCGRCGVIGNRLCDDLE